jgi:hypothetical protein
VNKEQQGWVALVLVGVAAIALLAVEVGRGAFSYGDSIGTDPCRARAPYPGEGFDANLQRIVLDGLDAAACELGATREDLVLSFDPSFGPNLGRDRATIERAVRAGLLGAIDDAEARGSLGALETTVLREVVRRVPLQQLIEGGVSLADLLRGSLSQP